MQQLLFPNSSSHPVPAQQPDPPVKRGVGRPARSPEEKARIEAEKYPNGKPKKGVSGARPNAGRPRNDGTSRFDSPVDTTATPAQQVMRDYNEARAKRETAAAVKEEVLAKKALLEYEVQQGNFLPRDAIISATARAYAAVAQGIRSIPDLLERRLGLDPSICVKIGEIQDEALASLHVDLEKMLAMPGENGGENGQ